MKSIRRPNARRATIAASLSVVLAALGGVALASPRVIDLPGRQVFPESLTSISDGTLYVTSVADGGVLRVRGGGSIVEQWIKPGEYGTGSTFGVLADEHTHTLWVCSGDVSEFGIPNPGSSKETALVSFDLRSGKGRSRAVLSDKSTFCNDIAIGPDGSAYVTNSYAAQILRVRPSSSTVEVWCTDAQFAPAPGESLLDGIAFGRDGNLYVNTHDRSGIFRVAIKDGVAGAVSKLETARPVEKADGMRSLGGNQFAMIEGTGRLDRLTVRGDKVAIETLKDGFSGPTGVTIIGHTAWVSEGQLTYLFSPSKKGQQRLPFRIYAVPLGRAR